MSDDIDKILKDSNDSKVEKGLVNNKKNTIGSTIKIIGWVTLLLGIILGLCIGGSLTITDPYGLPAPNPLSWVYGTAIIISSFVSGILFIGFGEVINLLNDIKHNTNLK